ncbi:MAG TPA: hypothetical protein VL992_10965, partial [Tepidisphaeraceae bacterium]|nr:hypothetical protein [Tepidisphaeraceae bacterium]
MPRSGEYTTQRRNVMQVCMFLVLLAVIGLAALVDRWIAGVGRLAMGPEQTSGPLRFSLPANWAITPRSDLDAPIIALAEETAQLTPSGPRRSLKVCRQLLRRMMAPIEYLQNSGLLSDVYGEGDKSDLTVDNSTLAGVPAVRIFGEVQYQSGLNVWNETETVICAVFPGRQAVTLWLSD